MSTISSAALIFASLLAAIWLGTLIRRFLPANHLNSETKDTVKLAMGLVATMSALVLGLLVSSAKSSYDTTRGQVIQMAAKVAFLDRVLTAYGPEANDARARIRSLVEEALHSIWPDPGSGPASLTPKSRAGEAVYAALQNLPQQNETQRSLKTQAISLAVELGQLRTLLAAQSISSISKPMLVVVVAWLIVIFLSFSLLAPANATANLALAVSTLSVAGAIFLILELDRPFGGLIRISNEPLLNALNQSAQ